MYEGRRSLWFLSHTPAVHRGLRNAYFAERGLRRSQASLVPEAKLRRRSLSLLELWREKHQPVIAPVPNDQLEFAWG
jgi:hypothetical protein